MQHKSIRVRVFDSFVPRIVTVTGDRNIRTLKTLIEQGHRGATTAEHFPAGFRVSHYIYRLRGYGIPISMTNEPNSDGRGVHGRYRLECRVEILPDEADPSDTPSPAVPSNQPATNFFLGA